MTRQTTALLTIGPRTVSPWGDTNIWRVAGTAQLVEGGAAPYWIVTPTSPAEHSVTPSEMSVEMPTADAVVESVAMLLAAHFGADGLASYLEEHHNLTVGADGRRDVAPYWDVSDARVLDHLARELSPRLRLGFTLLDDLCLVDEEVVTRLRSYGFTVDVFTPCRSLAAS